MSYLKKVSCPSCGASIEIKFPGLTQATCEYCETICTFDRDAVSNSGIKSRVIPPFSRISMNQEIRIRSKKYTVVGRVTYGYSRKEGELGGSWDEWYLHSGSEELWLTEDSGVFYLEGKLDSKDFPSEKLNLEDSFPLNKGTYLVTEVGTVVSKGIEGMLPFELLPEESYEYADSRRSGGTGPDTVSIEYDEDVPSLYVGEVLEPEDLKYEESANPIESKDSEALRCNSCGSPLSSEGDKKKVKTIVCTSCNTINEISREAAISLGKISEGLEYMLKLPLHSTFVYDEINYSITGRMIQKWEDEEESGYIKEYLLYNPNEGYLYLEEEEGDYKIWKPSLPTEKALNKVLPHRQTFHHGILNIDLSFIETGNVELVYVDGALPFLTSLGDTVLFTDASINGREDEFYSEEESFNQNGEPVELEQFIGKVVPLSVIYNSYPELIPPPPKPFKTIFAEVFLSALGILAGLFFIFYSFIIDNQIEIHKSIYTQKDLKGNEITTEEFLIEKKDETIEVKISADVDQAWTHLGVALYKMDTEDVIAADDMGIEYYHGTEDGESWSEGSRSESIYWKIAEPGRYKLLLTVFDGDTGPSTEIKVIIEKNAIRTYPLVIVAILWFILPIAYFARKAGNISV